MQIWIESPPTASQCSNFSATVNISQVTNFDSANYDITYDPNIIQVTDVLDGTIGATTIPVDDWGFIPPGIQGTVRIINNVGGAGGVSGTGTLAIINFSVSCTNCGNTTISFTGEDVAFDNESIEIYTTWTGNWTNVSCPTPTPTSTAVPPVPTITETPTTVPTSTPTSTPTNTPPAPVPTNSGVSPPSSTTPTDTRRLDGVDLLSALSATLLAGLLGFWLGRQFQQPLSRRVRLGLWVLIGGLLAYLLYGAGWLRPEQWFFEEPDLLAGRLSVVGLTFLFGSMAMWLSSGSLKAK